MPTHTPMQRPIHMSTHNALCTCLYTWRSAGASYALPPRETKVWLLQRFGLGRLKLKCQGRQKKCRHARLTHPPAHRFTCTCLYASPATGAPCALVRRRRRRQRRRRRRRRRRAAFPQSDAGARRCATHERPCGPLGRGRRAGVGGLHRARPAPSREHSGWDERRAPDDGSRFPDLFLAKILEHADGERRRLDRSEGWHRKGLGETRL